MPDQPRLQPVESPLLASAAANGIRHGCFTRQGGISTGIYASLNVGLGSGDERAHVLENRERVCRWFGAAAESLVTPHQVHSADVIVVDRPFEGERPRADAVVTNVPGLVLGVLTADCGPILLVDPEARVIAAAHAGWRGAFDGVIANTVAAMESLGAHRSRIVACLGPAISVRNYEVGPEFLDRFVGHDPAFARYFVPSGNPDHSFFDLPGFILQRLSEAGVRAENLDLCTYADEERFFSYRRTTHRGEPDYGRQISAIAITEG
ncbi:MAG TPA: peptidoglycan editing factor PgeF [Pararhizobium sp.]|nr:peptidoglycan editing factor PgeF [Pararhizobium sp.]